jgi:YihY family inner membrane protein
MDDFYIKGRFALALDKDMAVEESQKNRGTAPGPNVQQETLAATAQSRVAEQPPGSMRQMAALGRYLLQTEVHTYAFSVAANAILSLFPFIVLLLTISRVVFHSPQMEHLIGDVLRDFLPTSGDFVVHNMEKLAHPHKNIQIFSLIALLITSTGVFLPLEVALNRVWGVEKDRSYLMNQLVSLALAICVGLLAMASVAMTQAQQSFCAWLFNGHSTDGLIYAVVTHTLLNVCAILANIALFFFIYWLLPNRKIPIRAVLPTSIVMGLLWELAKMLYIRALPLLDFQSMYGPFYVSVGLMIWAFISGLLLLAGAQFAALRHVRRMARARG